MSSGEQARLQVDVDAAGPSQEAGEQPTRPSRRRRPKDPVDIEIQCGVPLPDGSQCARFLTCIRHSLSSKRAVAGRSAPFDQLLAARKKEETALQEAEEKEARESRA